MQQNHYNLLDVPFSASRKDITNAYRKQMQQWHPDKFRGTDKALAENYAKALNHAYSVLSNAKKRADYDQELRIESIQSQIMERYVAGSSGWNSGGSGPMPADAPRRAMTAHERREQQATDLIASRSLVLTFGLFALAAIVLLLVFSVVSSLLSVFF